MCLFSTKPYDRQFFTAANSPPRHDIEYLEIGLTVRTAALAAGADAVCVFVNDSVDADVVNRLADLGVRAIALRSAGFNNVDLEAAARRDVAVVRVPAYSPHAVAEHTIALVLALDRRIHRAYQRVRDGNFALDGLLGFDLHGRSTGVVGTGRIGALVARLFAAFGCRVIAFDPIVDRELEASGVEYMSFDRLLAESDVVSLNCPLTETTHHLIDASAVEKMKHGVLLVNTGRGALIDTQAVVDALKSGAIGSLALDVYEEEGPLFFEDRSNEVITDDLFTRLLTFPNVLITAHQGFFTQEALAAIAGTTLANLDDLAAGRPCPNALTSAS